MKNEAWYFYQDLEKNWRWQGALPSGVRKARSGFGSRNDCIADAMRHGYLASHESTGHRKAATLFAPVRPNRGRCKSPSRHKQDSQQLALPL